MKFILAKKLNMTRLFTENGRVVPVTVLQVYPARVKELKSKDKHGYEAVQIETDKQVKREFRGPPDGYGAGQSLDAAVFEAGQVVNLAGRSKGRGFSGFIKRHGFHGAPASHGHPRQRVPGSIGQRFPQHTVKGRKMAGRMGGARATVRHSVVVAVDPEKQLLFVKGGVPGAPGSLIQVTGTGQTLTLPKIKEFDLTLKPESHDQGETSGVKNE